ncbi:MAG: hypothetical protein M0D55_13285 [Elusimicrobiota bacterium]|nr:MAG: hypothetical protein M0D55_13285 [Elusimicrobiota bacterium]
MTGSIISIIILFLATSAYPGIVATDTAYTGTISAITSPGISITTNVYFTFGSSLTLTGPNGTFSNQSSVTASAFFGDGSHLSDVASLLGDNTFTGANTFTSSFTIQSGGHQINLSTGNTSNIKIEADGTVSFFPQLHNSSAASISDYSTTNAAFGPCIPSSTITFTTSGGRVEIVFTGNLELTSQITVGGTWINFLQDGQFVRDLSANKGFMVWKQLGSLAGNIQIQPVRIAYLLDAPAPGPHSYCLTLSSLNGLTSTLTNSNAGNIFYVKEIK